MQSEDELLKRIVAILDALGPFSSGMRREDKWRTTEQLSCELNEQLSRELNTFTPLAMDHVDRILHQHEVHALKNLEQGLPANALLRRAKYPDRCTALPLWGSVKRHGLPWKGHRPDRTDLPEDIPATLSVADPALQTFLSHSHNDKDLALALAEELARIKVRSWRFETHIDRHGDIAACVREAIAEAGCIISLLTRNSIASLWVLTELHTALESGIPNVLVIDTSDGLVLRLLESVEYPDPPEDFDQRVTYDRRILELMRQDYAARETSSRDARYLSQAHDFLSSLPFYLRVRQHCGTNCVWRALVGFPSVARRQVGIFTLCELEQLPTLVKTGDITT